jgi:hypothetical protein
VVAVSFSLSHSGSSFEKPGAERRVDPGAVVGHANPSAFNGEI